VDDPPGDLAREISGDDHRRVEPQVVVAKDEPLVGVELVRAEVGDDHAQRGVAAQHHLDALGAAEDVGIALVGRALRLAPGVDDERHRPSHARLVDRLEAWIVGPEALDVTVELHAAEPHREALGDDRARVGVVGVDGRDPDRAGRAPYELGDERVHRARDARFVRVVQEERPAHAARP